MKKDLIIGIIIGSIIATMTSVLANTLMARDIKYTPKDKSWTVDNVEAAVDDLMLIKSVPTGTIIAYASGNAPKGYLKCEGQEVSREEYSNLFSIIGTTYGAGNGSTTFNVPDLRGEFLRGTGTNSHENQGSGATVGTHQDATEHHSTYSHSNGTLGGSLNTEKNAKPDMSKVDSSILTANQGEWMSKTNSRTGTNYSNVSVFTSRPTNTSVLYCIKY